MTPKMAARWLYEQSNHDRDKPSTIVAKKLRNLMDIASTIGAGKKADVAYIAAMKILDEMEGKKE